MQKGALLLSLFIFMSISCANKPKEGQSTEKSTSGVVIQMNKALFIQKIINIDTAKEWSFLGDKPAIIDFYADWCGPCRQIAPLMKEFAKTYDGQLVIYKIDVDKEPDLAAAFGISSLPTVLFIPLTGEPKPIIGSQGKSDYEKLITDLLLKPVAN